MMIAPLVAATDMAEMLINPQNIRRAKDFVLKIMDDKYNNKEGGKNVI